jgi:hypothetical protein
MTMEQNLALQYIKAFENRYLMAFKISFPMCKKLGIQRKRLEKIKKGEIEATAYETVVLERFLKLPPKTRRRSPTVIDRGI